MTKYHSGTRRQFQRAQRFVGTRYQVTACLADGQEVIFSASATRSDLAATKNAARHTYPGAKISSAPIDHNQGRKP